MKRSFFKITILIIIFGVPVFWYLFLQLFGENKFELYPIRLVEHTCWNASDLIFLVRHPENVAQENQLTRLETLLSDRSVQLTKDSVNCLVDTATHALYLFDQKKLIGYYDLTILEVDRLIVELDLMRSK